MRKEITETFAQQVGLLRARETELLQQLQIVVNGQEAQLDAQQKELYKLIRKLSFSIFSGIEWYEKAIVLAAYRLHGTCSFVNGLIFRLLTLCPEWFWLVARNSVINMMDTQKSNSYRYPYQLGLSATLTAIVKDRNIQFFRTVRFPSTEWWRCRECIWLC